MIVRKYENGNLDARIDIWNEVVEAGDAFPQEEPLMRETGLSSLPRRHTHGSKR